MSFKRWLSLSMAAMFLFFFAFSASAADYTIKVGTIQPESHPDCVLMREVFQKYVEENSGGRIKVELYPNAQMGGDREMAEAVIYDLKGHVSWWV
ncbi:TRAP-type C4-dicarboxylate transport system, periplasmic component [Acetomicrobium mobile DSM 13181]|uniref:TRAP-type C4-dicarboxylate transport system, periplasmic component n=1 Tax=Acetomicrobium mobile (strain ATCC BAA-54 / DSM 13181 / JCM 12221 / NGA) TaxID=891968 RepID=I4BZ56_ACEMN|nr:hypothetical protein [Acetomicrobium mobile]AFM22563.1 TRAP-type C4-dicarboxylate transport system, periplasmic component [Acetomicrobium mobile DSM 13181]